MWRRRLVPAVLIVALAGAVGWWQWRPAAQEPGYTTTRVERGTIEDAIGALGKIQPRDYVDVGTQVSGQLRTIHVAIGDRVRQGDLLAEIDPTVWQTRVDGDRAQIGNLEAQVTERRARLVQARQALRRQQNLRRADATSDEALESAEAEAVATEAQIAALEAQLGQTRSQLRGDLANLGYTRIHAPMSGTIVSISARQGQTLNANQSAPIILRVADLAVMTVRTQVSEADVARLRLGQPVWFTTLGDPDRRYEGTLRQILPTPEVLNNVVLYNALFDVPNPTGGLMTEMTAQAFFVVAQARDVLTVPAGAVRSLPGGERGTVSVIGADGAPEEREVRLGVANRTSVEIRGGLVEGEEVVTGAPSAPRPGGPPASAFRPRLG